MTTTRQKAWMCLCILGLSAWCSYELLQGWIWNGLVFWLMAVACATMLVWQAGEEKQMTTCRGHGTTWSAIRLHPVRGYVPFRSLLFCAILRHGARSGWTWRVKR